ncbi:chloramphenicol acetyltransferase [Desulfovibrio sp. A2]|nr:chloramphenicol acetyltransferase [Desulfovibrio sp. A2]
MRNPFESPFQGKFISEQVTNPNIEVGRFSYYSGYYHGHGFDDCARYLAHDRDDVDRLIIGSFCSIGTGACFIMAGNQGHNHNWVSTYPFFYMRDGENFREAADAFERAGDTVIGSDVWIGAEAVIMPGIRVGHGALIGARAVVTRDVEPYSIVAGNPGRAVRKRFSEDQIAMLLEMCWWDWPLEDINTAMRLLCSGHVEMLYHHWQAARTG